MGNFVFQYFEIVGEYEAFLLRKADFTGDLLMKIEAAAWYFQLSKQTIERGTLVAGFGIIGDCMQSGFKESVVSVVIGIEASQAGMLFEQNDIGRETG